MIEMINGLDADGKITDVQFVADGVELLRLTDRGETLVRGVSTGVQATIAAAVTQWAVSDADLTLTRYTAADLAALGRAELEAVAADFAARLGVYDE